MMPHRSTIFFNVSTASSGPHASEPSGRMSCKDFNIVSTCEICSTFFRNRCITSRSGCISMVACISRIPSILRYDRNPLSHSNSPLPPFMRIVRITSSKDSRSSGVFFTEGSEMYGLMMIVRISSILQACRMQSNNRKIAVMMGEV